MASISTSADGRRTIQFVAADGNRPKVRLGCVSKKIAEAICTRVEDLNNANIAGTPFSEDTAKWLRTVGDKLYRRLVKARLVQPRLQDKATEPTALGAFLDAYIAKRATAKKNSVSNLVSARKRLVKCYGADRDIRSINAGDADDLALFLRAEGYAEATVGRTIKHAKQFFRAAKRAGLIKESPFLDVKAPHQKNSARQFFVTREITEAVLNACPDAEWRLIFALGRYGGLRCPSEHMGLLWAEVDWARDRFLVHSPKTEHHPNGESRWVPIFPELRSYLQEAWDLAEEGAVHVIKRQADSNSNLRTQLNRIIKRAGLKPWPKPFQNLRSSRQTELSAEFPAHVVCAWIGNSEKVAAEHYLQVREEDFQRAAKAGQKTGQHTAVSARTSSQDLEGGQDSESEPLAEVPVLQGSASRCEEVRDSGHCGEEKEYAWRDSNPQPTAP